MDSPPKFNIMYVIIIFNNIFMFISDTLVTPPVISNIPFIITEKVLLKFNISLIKMVNILNSIIIPIIVKRA